MRTTRNAGFAEWILILILAATAVGDGAYELHKGSQKNTAKPIVATVTAVEAAQQTSTALAAQTKVSDEAQSKLAAAHAAETSDIRGSATGAKIALSDDPNPSIQSKIAALMVDDILDITGPAPTAQELKYRKLVTDLAAANAALVAENTNLKNVVLTTTTDFTALKVEHAQTKANLTVAQSTAAAAKTAEDAAVSKVVIANGVALSSAHQITIVNLTWSQRFKAWFLGLGLFGVGGALALFVALPLIGLAFPTLAPIIKSATGFVLGLWHKLADDAVAEVKALHAAVETKLAAEQAAHAVTQTALTTSRAQVVSIATTPTVADQLVASMAAAAPAPAIPAAPVAPLVAHTLTSTA